MRKLLYWLTRDDVARTNAAQASVRLQHRRHDRDDIDAYLAEYATAHEFAGAGRVPTNSSRPDVGRTLGRQRAEGDLDGSPPRPTS
jgi:hypothetical protein